MPRRRLFSALLLSLGLVVAGATSVEGEPPIPRGYVCYRARTPLAIDGKLDDAAWRDAPWSEAFVDIEGAKKPAPRFHTQVKMLWDDHFFYVGARLEEPHVWATLTRHDSVIFHDNDFEVFIDPDGDNHEYYEFEINALNTGWDLFLPKPYRDGGKASDDWEIPGLKTAVHVDGTLNDPTDVDRAWSVELAFPWRVLGEHAHRPAPPRDGDHWRVNFSRVEWQTAVLDRSYQVVPGRREDNWVWSPQGVVDMHQPEHWGYVQFSTASPGSATFRPDPEAPLRDLLMRIYHAQKTHRETHKKWAASLAELGLHDLPTVAGEEAIGVNRFDDDYDAVIHMIGDREHSPFVWIVHSDSRLRREVVKP